MPLRPSRPLMWYLGARPDTGPMIAETAVVFIGRWAEYLWNNWRHIWLPLVLIWPGAILLAGAIRWTRAGFAGKSPNNPDVIPIRNDKPEPQ